MCDLYNEIYGNPRTSDAIGYVHDKKYEDIVIAIDNIPSAFCESKRKIMSKINEYIESKLYEDRNTNKST